MTLKENYTVDIKSPMNDTPYEPIEILLSVCTLYVCIHLC